MKKYPDLTSFGYTIDSELGRNREGGRITWKGICLNNQKIVVIKQFCFAVANSTWSGYRAYEQEIRILKDLDHPNIPSYLDSIETETGFCLIQEYICANNLSYFRSLNLTEIKQVSLQLLDILVYLQQRKRPILHRDIKPENILLDDNLNAYLIDFGFASYDNQELSGSHIFQGTPGFIAPEQIIKPTLSSDLYSLGVTIVCLAADQDISTVCKFATVDNPYQLELKLVLPALEQSFSDWLEKMIQAQVSKRFPNALIAHSELLALDPNTKLSQADHNSSQLDIQITLPKILGTIGIVVVSMIATWSVSFVKHQVKLLPINVVISVVAVIAISITQLGAISITQLDQQTKFLGIALSIITPTVLVSVSGLIWGIDEAVTIVTAITIAEIFILAGFWWQIPDWLTQNLALKLGSLLGAISLGIGLGLQLI